jgi:hypothetical protein
MLKYILGVKHHAYILFRLMRDVNRSGESDSGVEEWTDASRSDNKEEEDPGWRARERVQRNSIGRSILTSTRHPSRPRVGQRLRKALVGGGRALRRVNRRGKAPVQWQRRLGEVDLILSCRRLRLERRRLLLR